MFTSEYQETTCKLLQKHTYFVEMVCLLCQSGGRFEYLAIFHNHDYYKVKNRNFAWKN